MSLLLDGTQRTPESIVPWDGESSVIANLMERRDGEWVVAAAFLDYTHLGDVTAPIRLAFGRRQRPLGEALGGGLLIESMARLKESKELIDGVEVAAREMVEFIPPAQRQDVITNGYEFLNVTAGHYAVCCILDELKPAPAPPN